MHSLFPAALLTAVCPQIINIPGREVTSLDGQWDYLADQFANGYLDYRQNPMPVGSTFSIVPGDEQSGPTTLPGRSDIQTAAYLIHCSSQPKNSLCQKMQF